MSDAAEFVRDHDGRVHKLSLAHAWAQRAEDNVEECDHQRADTLTLALIEEVGEIAHALLRAGEVDVDAEGYEYIGKMSALGLGTREHLESRGGAEPTIVEGVSGNEALLEEIQDAAPLCWQLYWAVDGVRSDE